MSRLRILVVDDDASVLGLCRTLLARVPNTTVVTEADSARAAELLTRERFDVLIADVVMPRLSGLDLLDHARKADSQITVVLVTGFPTVPTAVGAMKRGAADFVTKPIDPEQFLPTIRRLLDERRLRLEIAVLSRQVARSYAFQEMIGDAPAMARVTNLVSRLAPTDVDVLITGETGVGKELVAHSIHRASPRAGARFVPINCAAIPDELMESELFGHERGAFTGADATRLGLFEVADGGTVFLDEIGELPPGMQAKLLRVLQERSVRRVGALDEVQVDVRVIAATNRDLPLLMAERRFRPDLYYRLHVAQIDVPPLRSRPEDIPRLVDHFMTRCARDLGRGTVSLDPDVVEVLTSYSWPGNVRELENTVRRMIALADGDRVTLDLVPDEITRVVMPCTAGVPGAFFALKEECVAAFECGYLRDLMRSCQGDVVRAAREAGVPRGSLYRLLKKYDIKPEEFRADRTSGP